MKRVLTGFCSILFLTFSVFAQGPIGGPQKLNLTQPNPQFTPGKICNPSDPNFSKFRYPAHIAYCNRNVDNIEKQKVAEAYGIAKADWSKYEFDHLIPLSAGGSDDAENIWPQPLAEAHEKDKVELDVFNKLTAGQIDQAQAVQEIWDWFSSGGLIKNQDTGLFFNN